MDEMPEMPALPPGIPLYRNVMSYTEAMVRAYAQAYAAAAVAAEREACANAVEALLNQHCAGTQNAADPRDRCSPDDTACDFVAAWTDAAAAIRERK